MKTNLKTLFFCLCALLLADPSMAYEKIFSKHCSSQKVPLALAMAVARQESDLKPLCVNVEGKDYWPKNKEEATAIIRSAQEKKQSYDVGIMQINCQWVKKWGIDPVSLLDPDTNIHLGVGLLKDEINRHGMNWRAVGNYHSPNQARAMQYAGMVSRRIKGNPELKSALANPRLAPALRKNFFKKFGSWTPAATGSVGQDHAQRSPVGWNNIANNRQQWLHEAKSRISHRHSAKKRGR